MATQAKQIDGPQRTTSAVWMSDTYKRRLPALLHGLTITMLLAPMPAVAADPVPPRSGFYVGGHVGYLFGNGTATLGRSDRHSIGRRHHPVRHLLRRRAGRLRASLRVAPDAGRRARHVVRQLQRPRAGAVVPRDGAPARPTSSSSISRACAAVLGYDIGIVDAVRDRRHRLGQHALLAYRPHDGQRGCKPQQRPRRAGRWAAASTTASTRAGRRALEYLYTNLGLTGHLLRRGAGALRFAVRPASLPRRPELQVRRRATRRRNKEDDRGPGSWEIHGQTTFIYQGYPPFPRAL